MKYKTKSKFDQPKSCRHVVYFNNKQKLNKNVTFAVCP